MTPRRSRTSPVRREVHAVDRRSLQPSSFQALCPSTLNPERCLLVRRFGNLDRQIHFLVQPGPPFGGSSLTHRLQLAKKDAPEESNTHVGFGETLLRPVNNATLSA